MIFVDLDNFKPVNDILGHAAGDELLATVARSLAIVKRADDIVGRIGGDEFLVVCRQIESQDDALVVAERIARARPAKSRFGRPSTSTPASVSPVQSPG